jgi:hypothetical protein
MTGPHDHDSIPSYNRIERLSTSIDVDLTEFGKSRVFFGCDFSAIARIRISPEISFWCTGSALILVAAKVGATMLDDIDIMPALDRHIERVFESGSHGSFCRGKQAEEGTIALIPPHQSREHPTAKLQG